MINQILDLTVQFDWQFFASTFRFWFDFFHTFSGVLSVSSYNYCKIRIHNSLKFCIFDCWAKMIAVHAPFCVAWKKCCLLTTPWEFPKKANHVWNALCEVLRQTWWWIRSSSCESFCPCYYSQIEGLGLHIVYNMHYVIRIMQHLPNQNGKGNNWNRIESYGIWIVTSLM